MIKTQNISISLKTLSETIDELNISWVNSRITDFEYPLTGSLLGEWEVQILTIENKMRFEDIVKLCKQDDYEPATIYHLLNFVKGVEDINKYKSLMAPGSLCVDDFECPGCVVLNNEGNNNLKLGLGNWRGSKVGGYDILRVKKIK